MDAEYPHPASKFWPYRDVANWGNTKQNFHLVAGNLQKPEKRNFTSAYSAHVRPTCSRFMFTTAAVLHHPLSLLGFRFRPCTRVTQAGARRVAMPSRAAVQAARVWSALLPRAVKSAFPAFVNGLAL